MAVMQSEWPDEAAELGDQRVYLHDVPWSHYEILMAVKGDAPVPRIAYLEGELELMTPSRDREVIKSRIRQMVDASASHFGIDLRPVGSWAFRDAQAERGAEPDHCYTIGSPRMKQVPDLVIEVAWTRGINKLAIYSGLRVAEVWVWRKGRIDIFVLTDGEYQRHDASALLPSLDVALVARIATDDSAPDEALAELERSWT